MMLPSGLLLLSCFALRGVVAEGTAVGDSPVAHVRNGSYVGVYNEKYDEDQFLGIPYAQPPLNNLRFRAPQALNSSWEGVRNATALSPACYQYGGDAVTGGSDDCLTLNVIRPAGIGAHVKLPVVIWIFGGGFRMGSNSNPRLDPSFIVAESARMGSPMIAVGINYRLHAWGFLWSSAIAADGEAGSGNLGFRDQHLAIRWVHENIAAFGGDPDKVTLWGQSAGAISVGAQLMAYGGQDNGLFRGAIWQSGSAFHNTFDGRSNSTASWDAAYATILGRTGCEGAGDSLQCLREVPSSELAQAFTNLTFPTWYHTVDGDFLRQSPSEAMRDGNFVGVPLLAGTTTDDADEFARRGINTTPEWEALLRSTGADDSTVEALSALYPDIPDLGLPALLNGRPTGEFAAYGAQWKRVMALFGDRAIQAPHRAMMRTWAGHGFKAYNYRFNFWSNERPRPQGVGHSAEMQFAFHNIDGTGFGGPNIPVKTPFLDQPEEQIAIYRKMATVMSRMWISFVNHLDPNLNGVACGTWPEYDLEDPQNLVFELRGKRLTHTEPDTYRGEQLEYWNQKLWRTGMRAGL